MNTARETIYAALFTQVSTAAGFTTKSRRLRHWDDVRAEEMPALFQTQITENAEQRRGVPGKWSLHAQLWVYVSTAAQQDPTVVPSQLLNPLLDAIEYALRPDDVANSVCTLGGLVSHCWISGQIETSEGLLGDIEVAVIPIEILVPN